MHSSSYSFSRFFSYIFHPLLIPTFATLALLLQPDLYSIVLPYTYMIWFVSIIFIFTFIVPVSAILLLLKLNAVYSVELDHRSERTIPLLIASISYMAMLYLLKPAGLPPVLLYVLYSATFALLSGLLLNMVYKISLHTLGWSALASTFTSISLKTGIPLLMLIIITVIVCGIAGYARLKQNAHNQAQVYLGFVAGVSVIILISLIV